LKVDFNYYPFPRIDSSKKWKELKIDSLKDIVVNKLHTISTNPRSRDFIDLFFAIEKEGWNLKKLIIAAKTKFDWHIDPIQLGQAFTQVVALEDIPKMLVPLDKNKLENFFLNKSKELEKDIFRK
jgi:hypothetical protein